MRIILQLALAIAFGIWGWKTDNLNLQPELLGMSIGILAALLVDLVDWIYQMRKFILLYWDSWKPTTRKEIRISIAYLFRIEVNGKYLLVRSHKFRNFFQPVGGVYKYFPEAKKELEKMGASTDTQVNDADTWYDLRKKLEDRKKLPAFLRWFLRGEKRETDPWREFYEELVEPGILPNDTFGYIQYQLVGQHFDRITYSPYHRIEEFIYADIYVPHWVSLQQQQEIEHLASQSGDEFIWVTEDEIHQGKTSTGQMIANHAYKIFYTETL